MTRKQALAELVAKVEAGGEDTPDFSALVSRPIMQCKAGEAYRGSLDAAKALHAVVLPGWGWRIGSCHLSDDALVFPDFNCPTHGERLRATVPELINGQEWADYTDIDQRPAGNVARAFLLSILRALHAMEPSA